MHKLIQIVSERGRSVNQADSGNFIRGNSVCTSWFKGF